MTHDIKKFLTIVENSENSVTLNPLGVDKYVRDDTKITAHIDAKLGKKYNKMVEDLQQIDLLKEQIKGLQDHTKSFIKSDVAALFDAKYSVFTRVIETKKVILEISKTPKPTETPQYKKILDALETHLTPDLVKILEELKKEFVTTSQREPSIRYKVKEQEESTIDLSAIGSMLSAYDKKLNTIKQYL